MENSFSPITKSTSLSTLIIWNIAKALEERPALNLKEAVKTAQNRLEEVSGQVGDIQSIFFESPYERHLACALLAWQQLGHSDADSLCRFLEEKTNKEHILTKLSSKIESFDSSYRSSRSKIRSSGRFSPEVCSQDSDGSTRFEDAIGSSNINSYAMGPVVRLPVETKIVMRVENTPRGGCSAGQGKKSKKDISTKIDQACCLDTECSERLKAMDKVTAELRQRVNKLAWREAERVELLERAETAWKDLEIGYQRRLSLAEEKEDDIAKQIAKTLNERTSYKNACTVLAQEVKERTAKTEAERVRLNEIESIVCNRACQRMRLSEEAAKGDAVVAENSTKSAQLDRDLMFKEEQLRRNMENLQNEVKSMRVLTSEAERATRFELSALRDQMAEVSNKLLEENAVNEKIKVELDDIREEKMEIIEDLEGCKAQCDSYMQGRMDVLTKKRETLSKLREKVMECRCKLPVDESIEVKRTPSLAALCKCTPEDKILESCSCTSMRTKLLSNLFADLFGGLHFELTGAVTRMPCQLLKCLEDKHNWDRASVVKSNLQNYFSKLLAGELDIAIATSIENYHAKWVGVSCADAIKMTPGPQDNPEHEGWEQRAIERRAQKLATNLAEQLFQERAEELIKRARDIVESGPPPCECNTRAKIPEGCHCATMKPSATSGASLTSVPPEPDAKTQVKQVFWHHATKDATRFRMQADESKKDGDLPEKDTNDVVVVKQPKKGPGKSADIGITKHTFGDGRKSTSIAKNNAAIKTTTNLSLTNDTIQNHVAITAATSFTWQKAIQDVTDLRQQIEYLKKESIKKQDLKMMEENIANIIFRASANTISIQKLNRLTDGNANNETIRRLKLDKAVNHPAYCDMRKTTKRKTLDTPPKETKLKPILSRGIKKFYKKNDPTFAVNLCLCSSKRQQQQGINEKNKFDTGMWKHKISKDTVSQMSSSVRQTKPINNSFISEDVSAQTCVSKDTNERSCPSNCVCFHKIPSNTSIDKLLETLAKWKGNLDASFDLKSDFKTSCCDFYKADVKYSLSPDKILNFKSNLKSRIMSSEGSDKISSYQSKAKYPENMTAKATAPMITTDSEYMGAINLDKSNDELCVCDDGAKKNKKSPYKCIASSKCSCARILMTRKTGEQKKSEKIEKDKEIIVIKSTQEPQGNEAMNVDDTPKVDEKSKCLLELKLNIKPEESNNDSSKMHTSKTSDCQIQLLGVTLTDVISPVKNQIQLECKSLNSKNKKSTTNNVNKCPLHYGHTNKEIDPNKQDYASKNSRPVPEFWKFSRRNSNNNLDDSNNLTYLSGEIESPKCVINNALKQDEIAINKSNTQIKEILDSNYNNDLKVTTTAMRKSLDPQIYPCECSAKLEEFKNFINTNFATRADNEDAAIDVQSLKCFESKNESCVCCKKINDDDCKDLEDNAFQLLEEYLKKKLNEFKAISCSSLCVPSEEEEKIFEIIVQRVKRLISESTNQITCKCLSEEGKSQGSWNRAYGLLHEYLKMKIKKVQCSCLLAEDNKDTILPDVLDKISNLIEYDFQRLKDLCVCTNAPDTSHVNNKNLKQVNFNAVVPVKEQDVLLLSIEPKFSKSQIENQKILSEKTSVLLIDNESSVSQEKLSKKFGENTPLTKNLENLNYSYLKDDLLSNSKLLYFHDASEEINNNCKFLPGLNVSQKATILESNPKDSEAKIKGETPIKLIEDVLEKPSGNNNFIGKQNNIIKNLKTKKTSDNVRESLSHPANFIGRKPLTGKNFKVGHKSLSSTGDVNCYKENTYLINKNEGETTEQNQQESCDQNLCIPYIGYTINCTCDRSLGAHVCPKNISNTDPGLIDNIYKKLLPDEAFFKKISYIMQSQPLKSDNLKDISNEVTEEKSIANINSPISETTCCVNRGKFVLKQSSSNDVVKSHANTNTVEDNESMITDCSVNDDTLDWCECSSQYDSSKHVDNDPLKKSIYFPAPIDFDASLIDEISHENYVHSITNAIRKHVCNCELVPLCHVKMLIENIETKLANSNCTCDSLTPKVCPVHSTM